MADSSQDHGVSTALSSTPLCFFVPPHLFIAMSESEHNDEETKAKAIGFLSQTEAIYAGYESESHDLPKTQSLPYLDGKEGKKGQRHIYDLQYCKDAGAFPGVLMRSEGDPPVLTPGDDTVDKCYENIGIVRDFYLQVFNRNSIDGEGMPLVGIVHYDFYFPGAWWNTKGIGFEHCLVAGDGWANDPWNHGVSTPTFAGCFGNFAGSLEVIAHELTHGMVESISRLEGSGQPGALHEHLADVFGSMVEQWHKKQTVGEADWLIGENLIAPQWKGVALRSLKAPGSAYNLPEIGKDEQVDHMRDLFQGSKDAGGVHINSGIPNKAFYLIAKKMGGFSWEKAGKIWYAALKDPKLNPQCDFDLWARITKSVAAKSFGKAAGEIVEAAWITVGVLDSSPLAESSERKLP